MVVISTSNEQCFTAGEGTLKAKVQSNVEWVVNIGEHNDDGV